MTDEGTETQWSDYITDDTLRIIGALVSDFRQNASPDESMEHYRAPTDHPLMGKVVRWEITLEQED